MSNYNIVGPISMTQTKYLRIDCKIAFFCLNKKREFFMEFWLNEHHRIKVAFKFMIYSRQIY